MGEDWELKSTRILKGNKVEKCWIKPLFSFKHRTFIQSRLTKPGLSARVVEVKNSKWQPEPCKESPTPLICVATCVKNKEQSFACMIVSAILCFIFYTLPPTFPDNVFRVNFPSSLCLDNLQYEKVNALHCTIPILPYSLRYLTSLLGAAEKPSSPPST